MLAQRNPVPRERDQLNRLSRLEISLCDNPQIGTGPARIAEFLDEPRIAHSPGESRARNARGGHLEHHIPDGQPVSDAQICAFDPRYGQVFSKHPRTGRNIARRPERVILARIEIKRLPRTAMVSCIHNRIAFEAQAVHPHRPRHGLLADPGALVRPPGIQSDRLADIDAFEEHLRHLADQPRSFAVQVKSSICVTEHPPRGKPRIGRDKWNQRGHWQIFATKPQSLEGRAI